MKEAMGAHYEHGVDKPKQRKSMGNAQDDYGCSDFKSQAMDTAYGQAGMEGCKMDMRKINSQHFKEMHDK